ncbi:Modulator of FtsH protease HflC [Bordetella pertussis]|uniref:Exported protein n=4 Tax=Bordetella pertussis TaxID=520 RepID=Q7VSB5_BORPE|nr:prohibitin family protein [Bordetella pertussis]ETH40585.1 SPFH domain/Band 7 family protein [Bordetella pertussis H918]ETH43842.1 SPFH domain/Band 7 family protein [Bordetella pertussis H939]ETH49303.1 SPFH domain/Band 7 family protein [Bordetella pertussis H921]ETH72868.1 SPFH domain/Band 7 family protein [Bordetella pertussis STO1-CHLA-0011]ETH83252.1 SPFH domain/Band 7 family protein [Bordetella pertussis STO1-CHOC-0017]ETH86706.1 SPFH domain/Band 7 family protein [Bordetella pertussis
MIPRNAKLAAGAGVLFVLILMLAFSSWFQVDQGERGVVLRNGKLVRVSEPGLDFKTPFIDSVSTVSVRDHTFIFENLEAYSYDQQPATLRVSVTYRVPAEHVAELYAEYGTISNLQMRVLERKTPDAVKNVFGRYTAVRAIQERQKLGVDVNAAVLSAMDGAPVQIVGVQVEEVGFSKAYEHSIEQRMLAQVQIETTRQQKETAMITAEIQVVKAKAEADARRQQFTAEADGIRLRGEAEAASIRAKAEALVANTNLVSLNAVEKWDGVLPATQVPGAALPFIGIK